MLLSNKKALTMIVALEVQIILLKNKDHVTKT